MRKYTFLLMSMLLAFTLSAQRQINDPNVEERKVSNFHAIQVATGIELLITQGNSEAVAVSAKDLGDREKIITKVEDGVLKIHYDHSSLKDLRKGSKKLKAYVSVVNMDALNASSGALVNFDGLLKVPSLKIKSTSGAIIKGKIDVKHFEVRQNSGSIITLSGTAATAEIEGSSGSVFNGYDLVTNTCKASSNSGGVIELTVNDELEVVASSGGNISYRGNGVIRKIKTSSGGQIARKS